MCSSTGPSFASTCFRLLATQTCQAHLRAVRSIAARSSTFVMRALALRWADCSFSSAASALLCSACNTILKFTSCPLWSACGSNLYGLARFGELTAPSLARPQPCCAAPAMKHCSSRPALSGVQCMWQKSVHLGAAVSWLLLL